MVCIKYVPVIGILWKRYFGYGKLNHDKLFLISKVNNTDGRQNIINNFYYISSKLLKKILS